MKRLAVGGDFTGVAVLGNGRVVVSSSRNAGDLLAEFKSTGRQDAFEEIVRRYAAMVFGVCLKTTRNAHDAEDATQAVFLTLAVQCKTDKSGVTYVGPWLQKVARRISLDLRRSRKRREIRENNHAAANGNGNGVSHDNGTTGIDVDELKVVLNEELNQLPAKYRMPMILHYYGGLSREEIAKELGCKASTLGVRIHRGRQMLAKRLTLRGASPVAMGVSLAVGLSLAVRSAVSESMVASTSHAAAKLMAGEQLGTMISAQVLSVAHGAAGAALLAKFKLVAAVVVVAAVLGAGAGAMGKVIPLDQLKLQLPFTLDGTFRLPTFRSPFRAPRAAAPAPSWPGALASAARSAAEASPVRTILWVGEDRGYARRPRREPGDVVVAAGPAPSGIGATGRLLARFASSVVASTMSRPTYALNAPPPSPAPAAPRAEAPVATASDPVIPLIPHGPLPPAQTPATVGFVGGFPGGSSFHADGAVTLGNGGTYYPLRPPTGMGAGAAGLPGPRTAVAFSGPTMTVGGPAGSRGAASMDGGQLEADLQIIGGRGHGAFRQRGGTNLATNLQLGVEPGSYGEYRLEGGVLIFKPGSGPSRSGGLEVGGQGDGVFLMGNAFGTGQIDTRWTDGGSSLVVRGDPAGSGVFRGWGRVSMGGFFDHNGQAIADGYGVDRTLEFNGFRYVGNSIDNPDGGAGGWYARNHGKLLLPDFRVRPGTNAYTWGEDPNDPTLDLVNSARLTLHDVARAGAMRVALLSKDHADVPTLPKGHTFIGVWQFDAAMIDYGDVDVVVRYDDALAHELHLNENILKLWSYHDGVWTRMDHDATFWRDPELNLLGATIPAGGFEFFAVSAPEPSTAGAALLAAGAALLRRRRRAR